MPDKPSLWLFSPARVFGDCLACFLDDLPDTHLAVRFKSAAETLAALADRQPDLMVVDLWHANRAALNLAHAIKAQRPVQPCLVLVDTPKQIERARAAGAEAILLWRLWPDTLEARVTQLVGPKRTVRRSTIRLTSGSTSTPPGHSLVGRSTPC